MDEFDSLDMKLKPGDEVVFQTGSWRAKERRIVKVERITPTGQVRIEGYGMSFSRDGYQRGGDYTYPRLLPLTPELRVEVTKERAIDSSRTLLSVNSWACKGLFVEEALAILSILKRAEDRAMKAEVKNG